ncbi:MAG: gamma-glutamyltransferase family protein [Eubacteriales bacterium]
MDFNYFNYPFNSQRNVVFAQNGIVATSQYLAAEAGLEILKIGGNAVDAAIATAACLTVTEPTSNGIGGDAFAIIWMNNSMYGLNSSGPAPKNLNISKVKDMGHTSIPQYGWVPVTVPGIPAAWGELSAKFGSLSLTKVLEPAINYAQNGFPVSTVVSYNWNKIAKLYKETLKDSIYKEWFNIFTSDGNAPNPGDIWRSSDLAETLCSIAKSNGKSFYSGNLAEKIIDFSNKTGGFLNNIDLEEYQPEWVTPISINYRGYDIWELPPNGQGLVALLALNILNKFDLEKATDNELIHKQIEAIKLGFADGFKYIADPKYMQIDLTTILSDNYSQEKAKQISNFANKPEKINPYSGGTVYLATADKFGNMVSYIQSNYRGFGSGLVVPGTGIALHNRGCGFTLDPNHPNCLSPGKRPYHTIIPGFITKDNKPIGPFGVMGALMQPQGHVQVISNLLDKKLNQQASLDKPRWQWTRENHILVEDIFESKSLSYLKSHGHNISISTDTTSFGRGQIIWKNSNDIYVAGTEPRADSTAASW